MSMLADKPSILPTRNTSHVPLPPIGTTLHRPVRLHRRPPKGPITSNTPENVSALKAKYTDYTTWLKSSTRHNREPVLTEEILKHSLCQMGINVNQAEQLVSKCKWYVYQFQKDLQTDEAVKESRLPQQTEQQCHKTKTASKGLEDDSSLRITSLNTSKLKTNNIRRIFRLFFSFQTDRFPLVAFLLLLARTIPFYRRFKSLTRPAVHGIDMLISIRVKLAIHSATSLSFRNTAVDQQVQNDILSPNSRH